MKSSTLKKHIERYISKYDLSKDAAFFLSCHDVDDNGPELATKGLARRVRYEDETYYELTDEGQFVADLLKVRTY